MKPSDLFRKVQTARRLSSQERAQVLRVRLGLKPLKPAPDYDADEMRVWGHNVAFLRDPAFKKAYLAGMNSGHHIGRPVGSTADIHIEWRVHTILWAASHALHLDGDFVECGVNTGMYSLAICNYLDFNSCNKSFYLFDTYDGIPTEQMSEAERAGGREEESRSYYSECFELVQSNFAPFPKAHLVRGMVPDTLNDVHIEKVAYLSIDMNIAAPEIAALKHFWPRLVPGGIVVFDDYGWTHFAEQKAGIDEFAASVGCQVLNLPTGQGMLVKPL